MAEFIAVGYAASGGATQYTPGTEPCGVGSNLHGAIKTDAANVIHHGDGEIRLQGLDVEEYAASKVLSIGCTNATRIEMGIVGMNTVIKGNLVVDGTTFSTKTETVLIEDNHLYLNAGYTTVATKAGGITVNYLPTATTDTTRDDGFTAPDAVDTTGAATFAAGDLIQVSGTKFNDGLYEVRSHAAHVLTIKSTPSAAVASFVQTAFVNEPGAGFVITKVTVACLDTDTDGVWRVGGGSSSDEWTWYDLVTTRTLALQEAYTGGDTIAVTGTPDRAVTFIAGSGSPTKAISINNDLKLLLGTDENGSIYYHTTSGNERLRVICDRAVVDAIEITATNAAGGIDVNSGTGGMTFDSTGTISMDSTATTGTSTFTHTGAAGSDLTLSCTAGSVNVIGGEAAKDAIKLKSSNASGSIQFDSGSNSIVLGELETESGSKDLRLGWGTSNPANGTGYGKGSLFVRVDEGVFYLNTGTEAAVNWTVVG